MPAHVQTQYSRGNLKVALSDTKSSVVVEFSWQFEVHAPATGQRDTIQRCFDSGAKWQTGRGRKNYPGQPGSDRKPGEEKQNAGASGEKRDSCNPLFCGLLVFRCAISFLLVFFMSMWLLQIEILQKTTEIYEEERFFLQQELESREQQLRRELADKRRVEQHLNSVVKDTQLKWEKECVSYYPHSRIKRGSLDFRFTSLPLRASSLSASFFSPAGKKSECCHPGDAKKTQAERGAVKPAQGCCDGQWGWCRASTTSEA